MQVTVGNAWNGLVETLLEDGRYASPTEIVEDGLRLLAERERKLAWLRSKVERSIAAGGDFSDADITTALNAAQERLKAEGH